MMGTSSHAATHQPFMCPKKSKTKYYWALLFCVLVCWHQIVGQRRGLGVVLTSLGLATVGNGSHNNNDNDHTFKSSSLSFAFSNDDLKVFQNSDCFVTKNICMSSLSGGIDWFYQQETDTFDDKAMFQPKYILEPDLNSELGLPFHVVVNQSFARQEIINRHLNNCERSEIPNHIVVTGQFIDMAMEVYVRLVSGLWELWNDIGTSSWWKSNSSSPHIQLYVHIQGNKTDLLPTMFPMLIGFSSNPVLNILDLFGFSRTTTTSCTCYPRLIFCGYFDAYARDRIKYRKNRKKRTTIDEQQLQPSNTTEIQQLQREMEQQKTNGFKRLRPGLQVGRRKGENVDPPVRWDLIRNFNQQKAFNAYSNLPQRILKHKKDILISALVFSPTIRRINMTVTDKAAWIKEQSTMERLSEWTLIGFSQRLTRRRWLNLPDILQHCLEEWLLPFKIICAEVNLDTPMGRVPENQVIMHAALDALIGVHGSQQVHAVWMPDGAFVLELLPHLRGSWGQWTQTTERRTPNGKMINSTRLNHVGYPLDAYSVPDCEGTLHHLALEGGCNNEKRWDNRDIWVEPSIVESFVRKFLVLVPTGEETTDLNRTMQGGHRTRHHPTVTSSPARPCHDFDLVANDEFVLYHINCLEGHMHQYRHYFRPRNSFVHLNKDARWYDSGERSLELERP